MPMRPTRPPTHQPLSLDRLTRLVTEVESIAEQGVVTAEALEDLAAERGVDVSELYAALAFTENSIKREHQVRFLVCAGGCQEWGALVNIEHLSDVRRERIDAGRPGFDIIPRQCLDTCMNAASVVVHAPAGKAMVPEATPQALDEMIAAVVEG